MAGPRATATFATALNADGGAPTRIMLVPAGPEVVGVDGRRWRSTDPAAVVAAFRRDGRDAPIDLEHATELKAPKGEPAPASGWIKSLNVEGGAIYADVEWTEDGARLVASRAYRYVSPAFSYRKGTGEIVAISSAALTNKPNLRELALNSEETDTMNREAICTALNIQSAASDDSILSAINALKQSAATPDPQRFVPKADLEAALNRATSAEGKLTERDNAEREKKIVTAVDQAVADAKIAPASKEHYLAICRTDGGLEQFEKLVATLPKIVASPALDPAKLAGGKFDAADPVALAAEATRYRDEQAKLGFSVSIAEAVNVIKERAK